MKWPAGPGRRAGSRIAPSLGQGPADGDFAAYVERLSQSAPAAGTLDSGDWGRDAFELDELSAQAGKQAVSAERIVAQSPYVSADLSLPKGVRQEVDRVRERAARALQAAQARASGQDAGAYNAAAAGAARPGGPPRRQPATALRRAWTFVKWGFIVLFVLFVLFVLQWLLWLLMALL